MNDTLQGMTETESTEAMPAMAALDAIENELQEQAEQIAADVDKAKGTAAEQEAQKLASEAAARAAATMGVNLLTTMMLMQAPYLQIAPEATAAVIDKTVPVLVKHGVGGDMPPWMAKYREEFELGMVVAGIGFGIFMQVQQHKQAEVIRLDEERQRRQQQNGQGGRIDLSTGQQQAA